MELSKRTADKTDSNIYKDLGTVPPLTPRRTATSPTIRIKVKETPIQTISDAKPRKAPVPPVPPVPTLPLMTMSLKSSISQRRLRTADGEEREQKETFSFVQVPVDSVRPTPNDEILILRKKIDHLESTVEELQHIVKTLQWHSDPQRQAALEDWAIEKMISVYNQFFPQPKSTIAELVRLFAASKQKSVLTSVELEYLGSLPRVRDIRVQDFMLTPPWFDQNREKDVKEIARYVVNQKDTDSKRNWRLYKFATGRSAKSDAKPS